MIILIQCVMQTQKIESTKSSMAYLTMDKNEMKICLQKTTKYVADIALKLVGVTAHALTDCPL